MLKVISLRVLKLRSAKRNCKGFTFDGLIDYMIIIGNSLYIVKVKGVLRLICEKKLDIYFKENAIMQ